MYISSRHVCRLFLVVNIFQCLIVVNIFQCLIVLDASPESVILHSEFLYHLLSFFTVNFEAIKYIM